MFKLTPNPTFQAEVKFNNAEGEEVGLTFTFKHKGRKALGEFFDKLSSEDENRSDSEVVVDIVAGWNLEEEFTPENIELFFDNYPMAALPIITTYRKALIEGRAKNSA